MDGWGVNSALGILISLPEGRKYFFGMKLLLEGINCQR